MASGAQLRGGKAVESSQRPPSRFCSLCPLISPPRGRNFSRHLTANCEYRSYCTASAVSRSSRHTVCHEAQTTWTISLWRPAIACVTYKRQQARALLWRVSTRCIYSGGRTEEPSRFELATLRL